MPLWRKNFGAAFPGWASGDHVLPFGVVSTTPVTPSTAAQVFAWPFVAPYPVVIDRAVLYPTAVQAGAAARIGIYSNLNGRPNALLQDLGADDLSVNVDTDHILAASCLVNGPFWVLVWMKDVVTQATLRGSTSTTSVVGQPSTALSGTGAPRPVLVLAAAYPGAMPVTAPLVVPTTVSQSPMPLLRVA